MRSRRRLTVWTISFTGWIRISGQGHRETSDGYRLSLAAHIDLSDFDTILLGTPNRFNTVAPPAATFLAGSDFSGKTIIPFVTNGGGGLGHIPADIKALAKGAKVLDSLNIHEDGGSGAKNKITDWLKKSGLQTSTPSGRGVAPAAGNSFEDSKQT